MRLKDFIEKAIKDAGYEGLYNADIECACVLGDLMPCDEPNVDECCLGYRADCTDESCEGHGKDGHFHICARKPPSRSL